MRPILAGIETEYGLEVENRGAENQIEDAQALVRSFPGKRFSGWDYASESPRADLRGFKVNRLAADPNDARFDEGRSHGPDAEVRSDQVLTNGARFYNDHGHPEYATPECWGLDDLVLHDLAGELAVLVAAKTYSEESGNSVRIYKNNTDFHGASYGCHESYLVPREIGFDRLHRAVTPILIARHVLCGSGKVGSESGRSCAYQLSQRADFFTSSASVETLYRRPVFNTRDEPHADPSKWVRLHVISGDANMIPSATRRKVGLVKLALWLEEAGEAPVWRIADSVRAFESVSKDEREEFRIELEGGSWTDARSVIDSYLSAAEKVFGLTTSTSPKSTEGEAYGLIGDCRKLLEDLKECPERFAQSVDWAAKRAMLEEFIDAEGLDWRHKGLAALDLSYHLLDQDDGLYFALEQMGRVNPRPNKESVEQRLIHSFEPTRALARGIAVERFCESIKTLSWGAIAIHDSKGSLQKLELPPDRTYPMELSDVSDVNSYIDLLRANS